MAHLADDLGARVEVLVDAVAEAHQAEARFLVLGLVDRRLHVFRAADLFQHLQHGFVGTAVRRAPQRGDAGGDARIRVGAGGTDQTHRGGGRVLLVIGVQDEQQIHGLGGHRAELQRLARHFLHHVQEASDVFEIVLRIPDRPTDRVAIARGRDGRHLRDQADRRHAALFRIFEVEFVVIEAGHRTEHADQHRHRMGVMAEPEQEGAERLVHHCVMRDFMFELRGFLLVWQFAIHQQIRDFQEAGMLGQLFDRVTAIHQYAVVTIDIGDGGATRRGGHEARVVGEQPGFLGQFGDIDAGITEGAGMHRQDDRLFAGSDGDLAGDGLFDRRRIRLRHGALP